MKSCAPFPESPSTGLPSPRCSNASAIFPATSKHATRSFSVEGRVSVAGSMSIGNATSVSMSSKEGLVSISLELIWTW